MRLPRRTGARAPSAVPRIPFAERTRYDMQISAIGLLAWPFAVPLALRLVLTGAFGWRPGWITQSGDLAGAAVALAVALWIVRKRSVPDILEFRRRYLWACGGFFAAMLVGARLLLLAHVIHPLR